MIDRTGGWHTSTYSGARGECVEVNETNPLEGVLMRDTQNRAHGHLGFEAGEWITFLDAMRDTHR
ncbi:DUF397 domain-containing protein [Nocardiopsis sp. CNT312]|uniref:DUF397 domain-containing protein n=1 Tax=Nocardiopsis sp. CNT312 TaxID=1137268 RepID=UPI00048A6D13|nr:DUF397 domain-containing protein [Nocardiopsis sp. CNT312]